MSGRLRQKTQQRQERRGKPGAILDAALIVKNEEHHLPACIEALAGLRPLLGEICVYDTGSTDRTVEICEAAGCRVQRGYWDDDFARARNAASQLSTATWMLHIDADEVVVADPRLLGEVLSRATTADLDVLWFPIRSWDRDRLLGDAPIGRLVRRETTTFVGRVHEHAAQRPGRVLTGTQIPADIMLVQHVGYSGEGTLQRKSERNAAISDAEVRACRAEGTPEVQLQLALIHRARARVHLSDLAGAEADLFEVRSLREDVATRQYAGELLVDLLLADERPQQALELLGQLSDEGIDSGLLRWKLAQVAAASGDKKQAWELMSKVDNVKGSLGETAAPAALLATRMQLALEAGEYSDAAATALALVGRHRRMDCLPVVLQAWQSFSAEVPARLLFDSAAPAFHDAIREALSAQGEPASAVAEAFDALGAVAQGADLVRRQPLSDD